MSDGIQRCFGSVDNVKNLYGRGLDLYIKIPYPNAEQIELIQDALKSFLKTRRVGKLTLMYVCRSSRNFQGQQPK